MSNLEIWAAFEKTDKTATKEFKRSGGFSGTAIKPMYAIKKMTEKFGACGIGWGYEKPDFQLVPVEGGEIMVYCTLGLWHSSDPTALVYGVGGDSVVGKNKYGLTSDDEAFKKAFTDALTNAMKHLGMAADVHMGQFDGNKYVTPKPQAPETMGMTHQEIAADWPVEQRQAALDKALGELAGIGDVETFKAKKAGFTKLYRDYVRYKQTDMAEELTEAINTVKKDLGVE